MKLKKLLKRKNPYKVAKRAVHKGLSTTNPNVLRLCNMRGWAIAHEMASMGYTFTGNPVLTLTTKDGVSVQDVIDGFKLAGKDTGAISESNSCLVSQSTLKIDTTQAYHEAYDRVRSGERFMDFATLSLQDHRGWSIAHIQAGLGCNTDDLEILVLADEDGVTVSHVQAYHGWPVDDSRILTLVDNSGYSVLHAQNDFAMGHAAVTDFAGALQHVKLGMRYGDTTVLGYSNFKGWTIAHAQTARGWIPDNPMVLDWEDIDGISVREVYDDYVVCNESENVAKGVVVSIIPEHEMPITDEASLAPTILAAREKRRKLRADPIRIHSEVECGFKAVRVVSPVQYCEPLPELELEMLEIRMGLARKHPHVDWDTWEDSQIAMMLFHNNSSSI